MIRGTIFHNPQFKFHDGTIGNKLLVLLNSPTQNESCLFVPTTSQRKDKPSTIGCFKHRYTGIFFLPKSAIFFIKDTWILLSEFYEIETYNVTLKNRWNEMDYLPEKLVKQIIDCLFTHHEDDISELHESWLRPPITTSIQKLKEKFNKAKN